MRLLRGSRARSVALRDETRRRLLQFAERVSAFVANGSRRALHQYESFRVSQEAAVVAFLTTLAQICAALIGIFAAAFGLWVSFLVERTSQFDDAIAQDKVEIAATIKDLHSAWQLTYSYVPFEFSDTYRALSNRSGVAMATSSALDNLFIDPAELTANKAEPGNYLEQSIIRERHLDNWGGLWQGRLYLWSLNNIVNAIYMYDPAQMPQPIAAYPASPSGPGFAQWRRDFSALRSTLVFIRPSRDGLLANFIRFVRRSSIEDPRSPLISRLARSQVQTLYADVDLIQNRLSDIDKQQLLRDQYAIHKRTNIKSTIVTLGISFVIGVILPLSLLSIQPGRRAGSAVVSALLVVVPIGLIVYACAQFYWGITRPGTTGSYMTDRWLQPLSVELKDNTSRTSRGALLPIYAFSDLMGGPDQASLSPMQQSLFTDYIVAGKRYNDAALSVALAESRAMRREINERPALKGAISHRQLVGGSYPVHLISLLDDKTRNDVERAITSPRDFLIFEIEHPTYDRAEVTFDQSRMSYGVLRSLFELSASIALRYRDRAMGRLYEKRRNELSEASERLRVALPAPETYHSP